MTRRSPLAHRVLLGAGALLLTAPVLTSCGFDYATNRVNTIQMGITERAGQVDILGAVIVSAQPGSGTFVASLVNNDTTEPVTLETLAGLPGSGVTGRIQEPVEIPARGRVTFGDVKGIAVEGDFVPGEFVPVVLGFDNGESSTVNLPVVPGCRQWEGLDTSSDVDATQPEAANASLDEPEGSEEPSFPSNGVYYTCEPISEPSEHSAE